jgi:hypothetical protein
VKDTIFNLSTIDITEMEIKNVFMDHISIQLNVAAAVKELEVFF